MAKIVMEDTTNSISAPSGAHNLCSHDGAPDMLHTCAHPYHSSYSSTHLPPLLFRLEAPTEPPTPPVIRCLTEDGAASYVKDCNAIRDFHFLPRHISVRVPGWLLEYWMRSDSRLTYRDIKSRMTAPPADIPSDNALNMRREREARLPLGLSCWTTRRGAITRTEVERVERLSQPQISFNTTMSIEYATSDRTGCQTPIYLLMKCLDGGQPHRYPLDTFMDGRDGPYLPGQRLISTIQLLYQLQDIANSLGENDWRYLPSEYLPESWTRKSASFVKAQAKNLTNCAMNFDLLALSRNREMGVGRRMGKEVLVRDCANKEKEMEERSSVDGATHLKEEAFSYGTGNQPAISNLTPATHSNQKYECEVIGFTSTSLKVPYCLSPPRQYIDSAEKLLSNRYSSLVTASQAELHYRPQSTGSRCGGPCCGSTPYQQSQQELSSRSSYQHGLQETWTRPPPYYGDPYESGNGSLQRQNQQRNNQESIFTSGGTPYAPESIRFNGGGQFSIRNNLAHRLNTNTAEVMQRNNPFIGLEKSYWSSRIANQRSFDDFFSAELE